MKMKILPLMLMVLGISYNVNSQNFKWSKTQGSTSDEVTWDLAVDSSYNIVAYGLFSSSMKLGNTTYTSKGGRDHYVVKYDCDSQVQWVQTIGSTTDEYGYQMRMTMDKQGSVYVASAFSGTCTFSSANNNSKSVSSNGNYDIYVAKYDDNGNLQWVKSFGGSAEDVAYDIASDDSSNVYVTGKFSKTVKFDSVSYTSAAGFDVFVLKLNTNGLYQWAKQGSGSNNEDDGIGIYVDSKHKVIVTGITLGTITFNGKTSKSNGGFAAKLDTNGDCEWIQSNYSATGGNWISAVTDKADNIYLCGLSLTNATITSKSGNNYSAGAITGKDNLCVAKYDSAGNLIWYISNGVATAGKRTEAYGICITNDNKTLYITGFTEGSLALGSFSNSFKGASDLFIAGLDTSGSYTWAVFGGGTNNDAGEAVAVDKRDNLVACGQYGNSCGVNGQSLSTVGGQDGYIFKYCNTSAAIDSSINTTGSTALCGSDSVLLSAKSDTTYIYQWMLNGSAISGATASDYYAKSTGSYSVLIKKDGCCSEATSKTVTVQNNKITNLLGPDTVACGNSFVITAGSQNGAQLQWSTGDTSNSVIVTNSGMYTLTSTYNSCVSNDTIYVTLNNFAISLGNDTSVCGYSCLLSPNSPQGSKFLWSNGDTTQNTTIKKTGVYNIACNYNGCKTYDTVKVTLVNSFVNLGNDTVACSTSCTLKANSPSGASYAWSTGDTSSTASVNNSGIFTIAVNYIGCVEYDTVNVTLNTFKINLGNDTVACSSTCKLSPNSPAGSKFIWSTGDTSHTTTVKKSGNYILACNYNTCKSYDTVKVTLVGLFVNLGNDTVACNTSCDLKANSPSGASYAWSTGDTSSTVSVYNSGLFTIAVSYMGCVEYDTVNVTLNTFKIDLGNDTVSCSNTCSLSPSSPVGSKFIWSTGDTSHTTVVKKSGNYILACNYNSCKTYDTVKVTLVNAIVALGNDTTICGASYKLNANSLSGSSYLWSTGDTANNINISNSGVYSIVASYSGCISYDTIQVVLKNLIVNLGNDTVVCGSIFELDAQNPGKTYKWSDGSTIQKIQITNSGTYHVDVKDGQCTVGDEIVVTIDIVSLNLGKDVKFCQNQSTPYTLDAGTASQYKWSTGDITRKITVNTTGDYWCKISDILGCSANDTISVGYYPAASAHFRDSLISPHTIKFIPDSSQYTSYFWTFDGTSNSSAVSPTQYFAQSGSATAILKVTTKDGCVDSFTKTVYTVDIDNKIQQEYNINLFPNPSNGLFTIDMNLHKKSDIMIQAFDLNGRKVYENKMNGVSTGGQLLQVNMQNMASSIYMVKITIDGVNTIHKLVNIIQN